MTESAPFLLLECEKTSWCEKFSAKNFSSLEHAVSFLVSLAAVEEPDSSSSLCSSSGVHSLSVSGAFCVFDQGVVDDVAQANAVLAPNDAENPPLVLQEDLGIVRLFFSLSNFQLTPENDSGLSELAGFLGCSLSSKIVVDFNFSHGSRTVQNISASVLKSERKTSKDAIVNDFLASIFRHAFEMHSLGQADELRHYGAETKKPESAVPTSGKSKSVLSRFVTGIRKGVVGKNAAWDEEFKFMSEGGIMFCAKPSWYSKDQVRGGKKK